MDNFYTGKSVLVTGGAGFVGSNLVRRLIKSRAFVTVLDNMFTGSAENLNDVPCTLIQNTVLDALLVEQLIAYSDIVFHLAARNIIASTKNPKEDMETNIGGTLNILLAIKNRKNIKMVYTSSASVYGNPKYLPINEDDQINLLTPYAVSKYAGEGYCMAFAESYGLPVAVLRLSNVYGIHQSPMNPYCGVVAKFMENAIKYLPIYIHGDGLSTRDFTYVDDVVDALMLAGSSSKSDGEVFNVATGIETSVKELANRITSPGIEMGRYQDLRRRETLVSHIDRRDIDNIRRRVLNIEKIRRKLGWTPKTTLKEGLRLTQEWMER
jgi:UDP-glucose 4-epimerase